MSKYISYDDALVLYRNEIPVLAMDATYMPEHWIDFSPSLNGEKWVFMKKFDTFIINVSTANPINVSDGEFYLLTTKIQKMKIENGKMVGAEELARNRPIAKFKTYREADEVCLSLLSNYHRLFK